MPKKNVHRASKQALRESADKREQQTHNELVQAFNRLANGEPINVKKGTKVTAKSVAEEAGVSRTSLYNHPDILEQVKRYIEKKSISPAQARRLTKEEAERKEQETKELIQQLNTDKSKLAQENYKLSLENEELRRLNEAKDKENAELKRKLGAQKMTIV